MRIAILIPSRNRPRMLSAVITALREMESGENEVEYRVGVDFGDEETESAAILCNAKNIFRDTSAITIGHLWNGLARCAEADIYSCLIDDAFPITPHWDVAMVNLAKKYEAFSWYEVSAPWNIGYPTCTKAWMEKVGYIVPEWFPFWFSDTWFAEMAQLVTNDPVPVSTQMALYSKQEATQNLREVDFWWGFFNATRIIRLKEAFKIGGAEWEEFKASRAKWVDAGNSRDAEFRGARLEELEKQRAVKGDPSGKYLLAKKRAENYLVTNNLKLWGGLLC